ncbi:hypothetical protein GGR54DRAFT_620561 [Hypoxylon sp. NC1633]|nr:hypothetical protein GGR54DRAFT_620561 [Hypoxylon sp. NC1633]
MALTTHTISYWVNRSQLHVYQCKKLKVPFAEFCFFCNTWLHDHEAWERDCLSHLERDHLPIELNWKKLETTFIPGLCPFCLWNSSITATARLKPFCTVSEWEAHVRSHDKSWQAVCSDGRCSDKFEDAEAFYHHMHDIHRVPKHLLVPSAQNDWKRKASEDLEAYRPATKIKLEEIQFWNPS